MNRKRRLLIGLPIVLLTLGFIGVCSVYPMDLIKSRARSFFFRGNQINLENPNAELIAKGYSIPLENPKIEVLKAKRKLLLFNGEEQILEVDVGLGNTPVGHKSNEGDGRTPEGEYYLCSKLNPSKFHLFLGISYPSPVDAQASKLANLTTNQIKEIDLASLNRTQPPWNTPLGGAVGIHGGGTSSDWTAGCIAVSNHHIETIFLLSPIGTPIIIKP